MNRSFRIILVILLFISTVLVGCKKDDSVFSEVEKISSADIGLTPFEEYYICADGHGGVYAIQPTDSNGAALVVYGNAAEGWQSQEINLELNTIWNYIEDLKMKATEDGSVWVLDRQALLEFKNGSLQTSYTLSQSNILYPTSFIQLAVQGNSVWLLNEKEGIYSLNRNSGLLVRINDPTEEGYDYNQMIIDSDNNVWLTKAYYRDNLLVLKDDGTWQSANDPDSLLACPNCNEWTNTYKRFWTTTADRNGITYLKAGSELYRITNLTLELMYNPYVQGGTSRMFCDRDDQLWMHSTYYPSSSNINPLVYRYEGNQDPTYFDVSQSFDGNVWIYDSTVDRNNNIWVATNKGVVVYNANGVQL